MMAQPPLSYKPNLNKEAPKLTKELRLLVETLYKRAHVRRIAVLKPSIGGMKVQTTSVQLKTPDANTVEVDEDWFLSQLSQEERELLDSGWPFSRRGIWPDKAEGFDIKYVHGRGWNVALKLYGGEKDEEVLCDTGTSDTPPYGS